MSSSPEENPDAFPVAKLLRWYRKHRRDLPWRVKLGTRADPYRTLVSEQMCQQTQVATVIPYFHRFLEAFPTVQDLANADEQRVLKRWQGLGYYRRARNLHAAAKMIVDEFSGHFPGDVETLLQLPGVGRYTAGAIASIAFDEPAPILDGNVMRVLSRHEGIGEPVDQTPTQKQLWARAGQWVAQSPKKTRGDFNQALMELGATVCTPQPGSAKCMFCPLRETCDAFATGRVDVLPVKTPKKKPQAVTHHVLAIFRGGKLLFEQRPSDGLWAKMWQLPTLECLDPPPSGRGQRRVPERPANTEQPHDASEPSTLPQPLPEGGESLQHHVRERFGLHVTAPQEISSFPHATTHRAITFVVHTAQVEAGRLKPKSGVWRNADRLGDLPLSKPQLRALEALLV